MPDIKVKGTMWDGEVGDADVALDTAEVERLFAAKAAADANGLSVAGVGAGSSGNLLKSAKSTKATAKVEVVTIVDPKTANNTAIALSRFRKAPDEIAAALLNADQLPAEQLASLLMILPTAEDVELVQAHDGPKEQLGE